MKRVSLEELMGHHPQFTYGQQYEYIGNQIAAGRLKPVKNAKTNGKRPALCLSYWRIEEADTSYRELEEELKFHLEPLICVEYYLDHLEEYQNDRSFVLMLNEYLKNNRELLEQPESVNERSFEIWNREKFLTKEQGSRILKRCRIDAAFFHMYGTAEPLAYYSNTRETPQNMLVLENKDTFFSMRRFLLDGNTVILGEEIGTLIYGGGKRVVKSFQDFELSVEPYMKAESNNIYYFGDLDYEGIGIYESLRRQCFRNEGQGKRTIVPFVAAYEKMLEKAEQVHKLPETKEQQNRKIAGDFFDYFPKETVARMQEILERDQYIPQEILNMGDY